MTTGEKIRALRKAQGLTQEELARKIGIKRGTLAQYESGKRIPKKETLERFAKALNVKWYEISHTNDSSWHYAVKTMDNLRVGDASGLIENLNELCSLPDTDEFSREEAIKALERLKQVHNESIEGQDALNKIFDSMLCLMDSCMRTENKDAHEAMVRVYELIECEMAFNSLNEIGERIAYYEAMQLLEPGLEATTLIVRIWKEKPEKVKELLEIIKHVAQTPIYCKQNQINASQNSTESLQNAAGDTPEDTDPKKD